MANDFKTPKVVEKKQQKLKKQQADLKKKLNNVKKHQKKAGN
ncbi:hypothetical protein HNR44_002654 [Geomicrobium halophilum]|uniref:Uncharacterized protein n=1 Tax=Geomicrobium halophilum TaxID=549000 RepID=A0A841PS92_9BACL|nr:hypothetical protein [Geomicrobium halophilum]MBB6450664.1 hypothetical protein [Geomicrobium halophilum]